MGIILLLQIETNYHYCVTLFKNVVVVIKYEF